MSTRATAATMTPTQIAYWLGTRRCVPTVPEIVEHTGCARASAYRWRRFALSGGQVGNGRITSLPPASVATPCTRDVHPSRRTATGRVLAALALDSLPTSKVARMLAMPESTAAAAVRSLHQAGRIQPVGHTRHIPASHKRAAAIRWSKVNP